MVPSPDYEKPEELKFHGSNWEDLNRIVALARFQFLQDDDYDESHVRRCAYVAQRFTGPALDWVAFVHTVQPRLFNDFDAYITAVREAFGVADNNITALLRRDLDQLQWSQHVPTFFAQFDRLTMGLGISSHETKVAMVESKLPTNMKRLLAEQALSFSNYETMRERLNCMWALDPTRGKTTLTTPAQRKPRCGNCGRKGHTSSDCRSSKK